MLSIGLPLLESFCTILCIIISSSNVISQPAPRNGFGEFINMILICLEYFFIILVDYFNQTILI